jgi:DNA primase
MRALYQMTVLKNLKSRHFDQNVHTHWVDEVEGVATFPLWNLTGQMVGFQQYRPSATKKKDNHPRESRYFTYRKDKVVGVWGLESWNFSNTLFVTEGVFDAARLTSRGYSAVATLSNDVDPPLARWLWTVRKTRLVVAVCDNDSAGRKLAKCGHVAHVMDEGKDMGEASDEYVTDFLRSYD